MNSKNTKRALLGSVVAMLVCFTMLLSTTFAWFTDTAVSGSNIIKSGTLNITLTDATGASLEGQMIEWDTADGRAQDQILWEPGCTYKTEEFYIKNEGNLKLKFKFAVTGIDGNAELLEVIDFKVMADASQLNLATTGSIDLLTDKGAYVLNPGDVVGPLVLSGTMDEAAGNEYQGKTIEGITVSLVANQVEGENDSFGPDYDADADRDSNITIHTADELGDAFADAKDGDVLTLADNINLTAPITFNTDADIVLDLNGKTVEGGDTLLRFNAGSVSIKNGTFKNGVVGTLVDDSAAYADTIVFSGDAVAEITDVKIEALGNGIVLEDNAKITVLNADIATYVNKNGSYETNAVMLLDNARIDAITGGSYVSTYTKDFIDAYTGSYSGLDFYALNINSANASVGEISGGTFLGRTNDGSNGATIYVSAGKIEKISGGYFGYCEYTMRNYPYSLISVVNGGSIDAITGGSFEYASRFGCDFENIVAASGSAVEKTSETKTVYVKLSSSVKTDDVTVWNVK